MITQLYNTAVLGPFARADFTFVQAKYARSAMHIIMSEEELWY